MEASLMEIRENITPSEIGPELNALWETLHIQNKVKACLFNLILFTDEERRLPYFEKVLDNVIETFPCRIFFIEQCEEEELQVSISAQTVGKGEMTLACDKISIRASKEELAHVPFLILPHLVSDLPIFLIWGQDPTKENALLFSLQKLACRVIVDSESSKNLKSFSKHMLKLLKDMPCDFIDMNWIRIGGWRTVFAQVFSNKENIKILEECQSVRIVYNGASSQLFHHSEMMATYFLGWLAAEFGWTKKAEAQKKIYQLGEREIQVEIVAEKTEHLPPGALLECTITAEEGVSVHFFRKGKEAKVYVSSANLQKCQVPHAYYLPTLKRGLSFIKEIFYAEPTDTYKEVLKAIEGYGA